MKKTKLLSVTLFCLIVLMSCSKINTEVNDDHTSFFITVTNTIPPDITNLIISMVGSEDVQEIDILNYGETTENFEFRLPQPSDDNPISFGDYNLSYLYNNEENILCIPQPETHISVSINEVGFTVEDMTYFITIENMSSFLVSNIVISMVGALESYQIDELNINNSSTEVEFHLINSSALPINHGCFYGSYIQDEITKSFLFSPLGNNNVTMMIFNDGYGFSIEDN